MTPPTIAALPASSLPMRVVPNKRYAWMTEHGDCTISGKGENTWDFWGSIFFTLSLATTIGYGNYSVNTTNGKGLAVLFSLIALPLFACVHTAAPL